jgi:hypothetical protein
MALLPRGLALLLAILILAAGVYLIIGSTGDDEGEPRRREAQAYKGESLAYIGKSLTALRLDASNNGSADRSWAPYSGPDAPEGAFLGVMNEGTDALSATVTLREALSPGKYYASVKGIDYDRHVTVTLAVGGGEAKLMTDDRDENGYWTKLAPLTVGSSSNKLTITLLRQGTAPGTAQLMLRGLYLTADADETVLADDQVANLRYPTERDTSPPRPGNLVRNGSFETGIGHGWGFTDGRRFSAASTWDREMGADGSASLRLPLDPSVNSSPVTGLTSTAYAVTPNKLHTLSAWVRTDSGNTAGGSIRLVNSYDPATSGPLPAGQPGQPTIAKGFEVGAKWQRVHVTGVLLDYPKAEYSIVVGAEVQRGKHLWIDGVSLNEGGPAPYAAKSPLEVGLTTSEPSSLFYEDEPHEMQLRVANGTAASRSAVVRYEIFDYMNRRVKAGTRPMRVAARSVTDRPLDVGVGRRGSFRIVLWVAGQDGSQEEVLYGVVPRPQRAGPDPHSALGIHSNFQAFTFAAMAKLGIKWDRALSPSAFFRWKDVEPKDDRFLWFDAPVALAKRRGVMPLGTLGTNNYWPEWADRDGLPDLDKWEEFVSQTATRYRGDVSAWEIWNEPLYTFKPAFYARMLKRGAEAVKRADPRATVVAMGGAASAEEVKAVIDELEKQYPQWPWKRFIDALSIHMYPTGESGEQAGAGRGETYKRKVVDVYRKPVWNTETGTWDRGDFHTENAPVAGWGRQLQEFKTAGQFTDASQLAVERLSRNFIESIGGGLSKYFYYDLRFIASPTYYNSHPTMLEYDDSIRPKGIAYAVLAKLFDHSTGLGRIRIGDKTSRGFLFDRRGTALAAVYAQGGGQKAITLPRIPKDSLTVYDSMGNKVGLAGNRIVYGRRPVYVTAKGVSAKRLRAAFRGFVKPMADTAAPNVTIDRGPRGPVSAHSVQLRWSAADDNDTPSQLQPNAITYSYRLSRPRDEGEWSAWSAGNSVEYVDLAPGEHIFAVRARDTAGNASPIVSRAIEIASAK